MSQNFQASKTSPQFAISHADCCEINLLHLDLAMQRIQLFHWPTPKQSMQANVHKMCNLKPLMLKFLAKSHPNSSPIQCLLQHPGNKKRFSAVSCRPQECSHALEIERPPCLQQAKKIQCSMHWISKDRGPKGLLLLLHAAEIAKAMISESWFDQN